MNSFLWGSATASYQCEGAYNIDNKLENMWDHYLHENNLENGDVASDFYHLYEQDLKMAKEGGQNSFRMSLAWPRILNEKGEINPLGVQFYRKVLTCCRENGLEPNVTIYHWDLPQYLQALGGWQNELTCEAYANYAKVCFEQFGDLVNLWVTFNEPRWFIFNGYFIGNYPPEHHAVDETIKGAFHVMYANSLAIKAFREGGYAGQIGIVHSFTPINGVDDTLETQIAMRYADNYCNNWVLDTAAWGQMPIDMLGKLASEGHDLSYMTADKLRVMKANTVDFLGLNYYARALVKPYTTGETTLIVNNAGKAGKGTSKTIIKNWFEQVNDPNTKKTEWDTEIYPQGLYEGILMVYKKYHLPIYITENGVGMYEDVSVPCVQDDYRIDFMKEHIQAMLKAKEEGADVRGYYAWSSFDLYSWKNGCEKRYGLVAVDFEDDLKRKPKASYYWYKQWIASYQEKEMEENEA